MFSGLLGVRQGWMGLRGPSGKPLRAVMLRGGQARPSRASVGAPQHPPSCLPQLCCPWEGTRAWEGSRVAGLMVRAL